MRSLVFAVVCSTGLVSAGDVATLDWLAGCWSGQAGPITFEEQWSKPVGGRMMGMARTLKQNQAVFSEFMRIEQKGGDAVFTPRIGTPEPPVSFPSIRHTATEVVFENADLSESGRRRLRPNRR